jgi:hypothetical protein
LTDSFSVTVSELKSFTVYSGNYVYAIQFNFLNGLSAAYGETDNAAITKKTLINLENSIITGVYMRLGSLVDSLQFKILNTRTNVSTLSAQIGGNGGASYTYDKTTVSPYSTFFQVTRISGFASNIMLTWFVSSSYLECPGKHFKKTNK